MKWAFLFPGQGAQYPGMGKDFYETFPLAKETFDTADEILGYKLSSLIFEGPKETLTQTVHSQVAIYVTSVAIWRVLCEKYPMLTPDFSAGLSLGEYTAITAAGIVSFEEGLKLVAARGKYMQEACETHPSGLAAVLGMTAAELMPHLEDLWIANENCPGQVVVGGSKEAIEKAVTNLKEKGAKRVIPLEVSGAFHTKFMQSAQEKLTPHLNLATLQESSVRVAMNVPGSFVSGADEMREHLISQVTSPTQWEKAIRLIDNEGVDFYVEIGPGKSLSGMNRKIGTGGKTINIESVSDLEKIAEQLETALTS